MKRIGLLRNTIQEYAWGSKTAIPELLGKTSPANSPQAELWMGAHPKAPSQVSYGGQWRSLLEVIREHSEEMFGNKHAEKFKGQLPFLFKVLAAAKPLSIQAHPNREQAERGFVRENTQGIPLNAPHRNYKDNNHKPEVICALTVFWGLNGFRRIGEMLELLGKIRVPSLAEPISRFQARPSREGLKQFFSYLMTMEREKQLCTVSEAVASAEEMASADPVWTWMIKLQQEYPGDIGVLSCILLNLVRLEPGDAMYLAAGKLHAYLEGLGVELMANSDNVLRGGLTPKHIDTDELLAILSFDDGQVDILQPKKLSAGEFVYPTPTGEFVLSVIRVSEGSPFLSGRNRSVEIIICTDGEAVVTDLSDGESTRLAKGISIIIPAAVHQYRIDGNAELYKAAAPT